MRAGNIFSWALFGFSFIGLLIAAVIIIFGDASKKVEHKWIIAADALSITLYFGLLFSYVYYIRGNDPIKKTDIALVFGVVILTGVILYFSEMYLSVIEHRKIRKLQTKK